MRSGDGDKTEVLEAMEHLRLGMGAESPIPGSFALANIVISVLAAVLQPFATFGLLFFLFH